MCKAPASIRDKSRKSLMSATSRRQLRTNMATYSDWSAFNGVSESRSAAPSIAFSGVRISWLILARNPVLARFEATAASLARTISSWASVRRLMLRRKT